MARRRERTRLLFEIMSFESDTDRMRAIQLLRYTYGSSEPDLITGITAALSLEVFNDRVDRLTSGELLSLNCQEIADAISSAEGDIASLDFASERKALTGEVSGTGPGYGPRWLSIRNEISETKVCIAELRSIFAETCADGD